jgi:hypothetical protein
MTSTGTGTGSWPEYGGDRMMVAEAWVEPAERLARYIRPDEMQQAFNFDFLLAGWDAERMAVAIDASLAAAASVGAPCTWVLSNHDTVRHRAGSGCRTPPPSRRASPRTMSSPTRLWGWPAPGPPR